MTRTWFKAKSFGWGWTPATWQGWVVTLVYVAVVIAAAVVLLKPRFGTDGRISFWVIVAASTIIMIAVCMIKGEQPRWRWGNDESHEK